MIIISLLLFGAYKFTYILYPLKYENYVIKFAQEQNLDPLLIFSIIKIESGFRDGVISSKNAIGLMQIIETTGRDGADSLGIKNFNKEKLADPEINIKIGCWYVRSLLNQFEKYDQKLELTLASYNGGVGNVKLWLKDDEYKIQFKETENFVRKVKSTYEMYKRLYNK